ncbi:MAG: hypothetical protein WAQ05_08720, partial [Rubrivivax sp.]
PRWRRWRPDDAGHKSPRQIHPNPDEAPMQPKSRRHVLLVTALSVLPLPAVQAQDSLASVADSVALTDSGTGAFFIVEKVDGKATADNMLQASHRASRGKGGYFTIVHQERTVPAGRPVKLALQAEMSKAGPPIFSLFSKVTSYRAAGDIEVTLQPSTRYRVRGMLDAYRREVWLEDEVSGQMVGTRIVQLADSPEERKAMEGAVYTCCNLHYEGDWISDANWTTLPMIPAGARIKVSDLGGKSADVLIDGRKMRIGLDYGRKQLTTDKLLAALTVKDDPAPRIAAMAAPVQAAIKAGKVMLGMTRDEVLVALGPPRADETASTSAAAWTYRTDKDEAFVVSFGAEGRVSAVEAATEVLRLVVQAP